MVLVAAVQTRSNNRIVISGSLAMFSNEFYLQSHDNQVFGRQEVMEITGCGKTQASKILNVMKMNNVIVDVKGKGKYVFKVEERV